MKRLVFCFDGTWNRIDAAYSTNVVITAESVLPLASNNISQLIYYHEGVGTARGDRIRGGVFGSGLVQNLADGYRFLIFNHTPGDEIYVFGFSRGAYTARTFVGLINCCGILLRKDAGRVKEAIELYQEREKSPGYIDKAMRFRLEHSPHVIVSQAEAEWRTKYALDAERADRLQITYLGVWDTVGALGIPASFSWLSWANKRFHFHDAELSAFVKSARHAVAIDERRKDFAPALWTNLKDLNQSVNADVAAADAPYQQQWFPGVHSSVGGGGERRGLSDQAMDWVLDGARHMGLELDSDRHSRIFELVPDYTEYLDNVAKPGLLYRAMNRFSAADRAPGPSALFELSMAARRRWLTSAVGLRDAKPYRPPTLAAVASSLDALDPVQLGVGAPPVEGRHEMYQVKRGDTLGAIALRYYHDTKGWRRIYAANRNKLDDPNRIYVGQLLRIPLD